MIQCLSLLLIRAFEDLDIIFPSQTPSCRAHTKFFFYFSFLCSDPTKTKYLENVKKGLKWYIIPRGLSNHRFFLGKKNYKLLTAARYKFGGKKCWVVKFRPKRIRRKLVQISIFFLFPPLLLNIAFRDFWIQTKDSS